MNYTKSPGIGGRLKQRISDFVVEEIPIPTVPGDEYTIFWLEKFNWDTQKVIRFIARKLHISIKRIGFAGTKDKRALTKQRMSIWKIEPERMEKIDLKDVRISNMSKSKNRIELGDHKGNKFVINIRDVDLSNEVIEKRIKDVFLELEKGIPNLFGPQRFGETRPMSHIIGKHIIRGEFEEAVKIYTSKAYPLEPDDAKEARNFLKENWGKFKEAMEIFPKRLLYERMMIDYLAQNPSDYAGAIRRLPRKLAKLLVNAYQSYIFNKSFEFYKKVPEIIELVGYNTEPDEIIGKILKEEKIKPEEFSIKHMPELKCSGSDRNTILIPKDLKLLGISDDEFNEGKKVVKVAFELPPGSYATIVLKEIMKN